MTSVCRRAICLISPRGVFVGNLSTRLRHWAPRRKENQVADCSPEGSASGANITGADHTIVRGIGSGYDTGRPFVTRQLLGTDDYDISFFEVWPIFSPF